MKIRLPCFKCGIDIALMKECHGVRDATTWATTGGYGSTVWNEHAGDDRYLEIVICDACLTAHRHRGVARGRRLRSSKYA